MAELWGRVVYCTGIYAEPENISRVYAYDTKQCEQAQSYIDQQLSNLSRDEKAQTADAAKGHMMRARANTQNVSVVIPACRQECSEIAAMADTP